MSLCYSSQCSLTTPCTCAKGLSNQFCPSVTLYKRANSCVDRLKAEGGRDSASQLIHA